MAKSKANYVTAGLSGKVGKLFVFRQQDGETIVAKPSVRTKALSQKQKNQITRFAKATSYAKNALKDPSLKQSYEQEANKRKHVTAYNMAIADYLRPPVIDIVDTTAYTGKRTGEKITVLVDDVFKVTKLNFKITQSNGALVEEGDASFAEGKWVYTSSVVNAQHSGSKITISATDRPGNITVKEINL